MPDPTLPQAPHLAIYRRFRAQTFSQMVGQPAVVETLRNAVRLDRLGHGFLFVGPRGTGKTSMARILAKAVNCTNLQDGEPCDACPSCVAIREGRALDVIELDAASNNRVDDMRELLPRVYTGASDLRHKVFIIDEVQRIKEGWDVLLKTLEEPPEGVLFVFCTTDPSQIRPAVVSRLQRFTFRPLARPEIEGKLGRILLAEGRTAEPEAVALIAQLAAGGMRDAESMLDQVLANADDPISAGSIRELLGLADAEAVDRFVAALATGDALGGIAVLDALEAEGRDLVAFAEQAVVRLRELLVARMSDRGSSGGGPAELALAARRLTGIDASRSGLGGYRWQLELALLGASASREDGQQDPARTEARPERTLRADPGPAAPVRASRSAPDDWPESSPEATAPDAAEPRVGPAPDDLIGRLRRGWPEVVAFVGRNPANRPIIVACRPVEVRDGVVVLGFPEEQAFWLEKAATPQRKAALEEGLQHVLGRPVGVRCVVTNLALVEPVSIESDDLVEHARRIFEADLVDVREVS